MLQTHLVEGKKKDLLCFFMARCILLLDPQSVLLNVALFYLRHDHYIEVGNKPHIVKPMLWAIKRDFMGRITLY